MGKVTQYRKIIQNFLTQYAHYGTGLGDIERQLVFDTINDHYQIIDIGWHNQRRIYGSVLHLDIKEGKVWIQHNGTEIEVGEELATLGIPKSDIVVGFHAPDRRQLTDFAVG